jgi:hypothetical protein
MGEVVITCAKCGTRQAFHGSKWEITVEAEVCLKQHQRAHHQGNKPQPGRLSPSERAATAAVPLRPSCTRRNRPVGRALHGITAGGVAADTCPSATR